MVKLEREIKIKTKISTNLLTQLGVLSLILQCFFVTIETIV